MAAWINHIARWAAQRGEALLRLTPLAADERQFCAARLGSRDRAVASTCTTLAVGYHGLSLLTDRLFVSPADLPLFSGAHAVLLALHLLWILRLKRTALDVRWYVWALQLGFLCFMGVILERTIARGAAPDIILAASGLAVLSAVMLLLCPFHNAMIVGSVAAYVAIGALAVGVGGATWGGRWLAIYVLVLLAFAAFQYISVFKARELAAVEYRTLRHIAPAQIVRHATASVTSIEALFEPAIRPVACISCDWRDYQHFSRTQEPQTVARTLNDYYDLCERLIARVCPDGNYYSDWIADELFIVIFGREGGTTKKLTRQALDFATLLIEAKPEFLRSHAMPQSIDVGISIGGALVGMMGPIDHRKATALGEIPGLARRIQGLGKLLRHNLGQKDRIIVHDYALGWLKHETRLQTYSVQDQRKLRDLDSNIVHYIEPMAVAAAGASAAGPKAKTAA